MMRIGVISDSHGKIKPARQALKQMGQIDLLLHAGDHYGDALKLAAEFKVPLKSVVGNCDWLDKGPAEEIVQIGSKRLFLTHGHAYRVKDSYLNLFYRAQEVGADLVVFGHTHVAELQIIDEVILFNPGSIALPRQGEATYGMITYEQDQLKVHIHTLSS